MKNLSATRLFEENPKVNTETQRYPTNIKKKSDAKNQAVQNMYFKRDAKSYNNEHTSAKCENKG